MERSTASPIIMSNMHLGLAIITTHL